jgi:hypothetical protein
MGLGLSLPLDREFCGGQILQSQTLPRVRSSIEWPVSFLVAFLQVKVTREKEFQKPVKELFD